LGYTSSDAISHFRIDLSSDFQISEIIFQNIKINIEFSGIKTILKKSPLKTVKVQKGSFVNLRFPDYFSIQNLFIKNASLMIFVKNFLIVSSFLQIQYSHLNINR
jgi:hypothetical protein